MANMRLIQLPFEETFLECTISTTVFEYLEIRNLIDKKGFSFCNDNIDAEKQLKSPNWWREVEAIAADFCWTKFANPSVPGVKIYKGTLEFQDGCHRAIALAAASLR